MRGNPKSEAVEAVATHRQIPDGDAYHAIGKRYGVLGKTFNFFSKLRGGAKNNVALELKAVQ